MYSVLARPASLTKAQAFRERSSFFSSSSTHSGIGMLLPGPYPRQLSPGLGPHSWKLRMGIQRSPAAFTFLANLR